MRLRAHPADPPAPAIRGIDAGAALDADGALRISFRLDADLALLRLPEPAPPVRRDGLWLHTCFEAFVRAGGDERYVELNFAPSGAWAAYAFSARREGMTPLELAAPPAARWRRDDAGLALDVAVPLAGLVADARAALRVALATVIEHESGTISYWALHHAAGRPDFHHPESFALELPGR